MWFSVALFMNRLGDKEEAASTESQKILWNINVSAQTMLSATSYLILHTDFHLLCFYAVLAL